MIRGHLNYTRIPTTLTDVTARKLHLLLGERAALFLDRRGEAFQRRTLRLALDGTAQYRHNAFHFNGLGGFAQSLKAAKVEIDSDLLAAVRQLWEDDLRGRSERLRETMRGAHLAHFLDEKRNRRLFEAVSGAMDAAGAADLPLPRFRRLLRRAANVRLRLPPTSKEENGPALRLPEPHNRADLEAAPARLAQYVALKLLYEHPFRQWLADLPPRHVSDFIARAVTRAESEAKRLFGRKDADREAVVTAKARDLVKSGEAETVADFLQRLTAETASEMRVQRGYQSDGERARQQASYIEDLRCDVLAQAFGRFLGTKGFLFLLRVSGEEVKPGKPICDLAELGAPQVDADVEDWQSLLYFILHLVPVDDASRLLHQIRKWDLLAGKAVGDKDSGDPDVRRIVETLSLYLDMHDAKFTGGRAIEVLEPFARLYASKATFDRVFPPADGTAPDERLPLRGLREIMRFGHLPLLMPIFEAHPVSDATVEDVLAAEAEGEIAKWQAWREGLHERWARKRNGFGAEDCRRYIEALAAVTRHRHAAAHVRLVNHFRLHRLLMAVLGRLVDFSGLWERDLYFVILALLYQHELAPLNAFGPKGQDRLRQGRIVEARRDLKHLDVENEISAIFGPRFGGIVDDRNDLAHFNMLSAFKRKGAPLSLTAAVNAARRLMAHDRKLRNAVSQSVIELLAREGLALAWDIRAEGGHELTNARVATRQATHLGGLRLDEKLTQGQKANYHILAENLHGDHFVQMASRLFAASSMPEFVGIPIDRIDWERFDERFGHGPPKQGAHRTHNHPSKRAQGHHFSPTN